MSKPTLRAVVRPLCVTAAGCVRHGGGRWAAYVQHLAAVGRPVGVRRVAVGLPLCFRVAYGRAVVRPLCVTAAGFVRHGGGLWAACAPHGIAWIYAWNCTDIRLELHG